MTTSTPASTSSVSPTAHQASRAPRAARSWLVRLPVIGALVAALAASACCIVPAVLAVIGLSGVGLAAAIAPYRPILLGVTAALLGTGLWLAYRRDRGASRARAGGDDCGCPAPRTRRTGVLLLWLATGAVALLAAYPYLAAATARTQRSGTAAHTAATRVASLHIDGMTCAGCASHIVDTLSAVPGVVEATASFDDAAAQVTYDPAQVQPDELASAVTALDGYTAKVVAP